MTLEEHIEQCKQIIKDNPGAKKLQIISSSDSEGNSYEPVHYTPTMGFYEDREFTDHKNSKMVSNAVCIN